MINRGRFFCHKECPLSYYGHHRDTPYDKRNVPNKSATVLNIPISTVAVEAGPAYGGAILAAVADGVYASVEDAVEKIVKRTSVTEPDAELAEKYNERYQTFRKLYPALKDCYREMNF